MTIRILLTYITHCPCNLRGDYYIQEKNKFSIYSMKNKKNSIHRNIEKPINSFDRNLSM